ncbi:UbiA family prenyltransferase [Sphingobium bisphenolivorans]|uniref:UbiA family prenyltransferase n=1 Tax=Sphingobium bisphenolivorans TaxID=1335760 RepID=UPI0003AA5DB8|nr:UbiA family prenyltransferase [Sphingobium bisphenolivorans]
MPDIRFIRSAAAAAPPTRTTADLRDYLAIARFDHATKHVFILPGIILAYVFRGPSDADTVLHLVLGILSAVLIASANYVINEWLDREFDAFHPLKSQRIAVKRQLTPALVYTEYAAFAGVGVLLAVLIGGIFLPAALLFLISGLTYNVRPFRTKDRAYVDVLAESLNNPIRLILGWAMVDPTSLPPGSLLLSYWMGGAFLMASKRLSEYRDSAGRGELAMLHRYRPSFATYTAENLTVCCFQYAILSAFGLAVFLIKYRIEYILAFPFVASLFALYLWLSLREASVAQRPERLFRSRRLMLAVAATTAAFVFTSLHDVPQLQSLSQPHFISFGR